MRDFEYSKFGARVAAVGLSASYNIASLFLDLHLLDLQEQVATALRVLKDPQSLVGP